MSEPIKNTLFRFATMRTPELIPEKEKRDYHIHHPNPTTSGFFATALASPAATQAAQLAALTTLAAGFTSTALKTTQEVKTYVGDNFFDFSVWLAKNHTAVFSKTETPYGGTIPAVLTSTKIIGLWDNLFYQLIKGISPQLRQFCIELLVANGYLAADTDYKHQLAVARVIIPGSFYGAEASNTLASVVSTNELPAGAPFNTTEFKRGIAAVIAEQKITACRLLIQELKQAEKKYAADNNTVYNEARKAYEQTAREILDQYDKNRTPEGAVAAEAAPETTLPPAGPIIPLFEFTPSPEMESGFLQTSLSQKSFALAQQLGLPNASTFESASGKIEEVIKAEAANAVTKTNPASKSVLVNNMVFPVNQTNQSLTLFSFYMEALFLNGQNNLLTLYTYLNMGVPDAHVTSCIYHAVLSNGTVTGTTYTETAYNNDLILQFFQAGLVIPPGQTEFRIHGKLNTSEGFNLLFDVQFNIDEGAWGVMEVEKIGGTGGGGQTVQPPSGYGIKRIGLADYRRVEQSVCCYLPGEVSHIENVMAREYKERSSRRLTRSEDTTTRETSLEKETQKDSASTERYELQKEIDSVISKDMSAETHAGVSGDYGKIKFDAGASFAYNTSREDSNHTAINYSKEVTEKALERVVMKIREERTIKIIEEFEEQQKHGYDNRLGDQHVSGVYRWIDKVYKNQVFNYGKRLMYEFMIPQPASFHNQAIKVMAQSQTATLLEKPVDPRSFAGILKLDNATKVNSLTFPYWAGIYNVEVKAAPDEYISISEAFGLGSAEATGDYKTAAKSFKMEIAEGYEATSAFAGISYVYNGGNTTPLANIRIGNGANQYIGGSTGTRETSVPFSSNPVRKTLAVSAESRNLGGLIINVIAYCRRTAESYANWQLEVFNAIINAYNEKLDAYNKAISVITPPETTKSMNPGFYRQIENSVLRKNCITYLVSDVNMGKKFYQGSTTGDTLPLVNAGMDQYASMVKFIEQAFEWEIMSYKFYPFYWGNRAEWQQNYQQEVDDPIFRSFLQAGMARAIVSIRPGFEEAVMYFMATGQIWNGGQVPAIGDDLYLSIVEELKNPTYYIDETWETRVPTTLTVIQSGAIGLNAEGLPCACGDENDIEQNTNKLGNVIPS